MRGVIGAKPRGQCTEHRSSVWSRARVGQYGEINQRTAGVVNLRRPTGASRSKACFLAFACVARLQISTVSARDCRATGVQVPPKLSVKAITWNVEKSSLRRDAVHGKPTVRQAHGGATLRSQKKRRPPCNGADRAWNMAQRESQNVQVPANRVPTSDRCSIARESGDTSNLGKQKTASAGAPKDESQKAAGAYRKGCDILLQPGRPTGVSLRNA